MRQGPDGRDWCLALVCDGMGGLLLGEQAARTAVQMFLEGWEDRDKDEGVPAALERATRYANSAVMNLSTNAGIPGAAGTTLLGVFVEGEKLHWTSVGDSGLFLLRGGSIRQLNTPHVYASILDERCRRGEISLEQALGDPQRAALTSYIGGFEVREIDICPEPLVLEPGDRVVLASDGLFKTLSLEQIAEALESADGSAAEGLVRSTIDAHQMHQDNITVVTVQLATGAPARQSLAKRWMAGLFGR